jgi:hypothetical protein
MSGDKPFASHLLVKPDVKLRSDWRPQGIPNHAVGHFPPGESPPPASPVFRKGWLAGADYVLEALAAGTPADEVRIVIGVVAEEAKPKKPSFRRWGPDNS